MTQNREDSAIRAIADLLRLEDERIAQESIEAQREAAERRAAEAAARAAEEEAKEQERQRELREAEALETEARLRSEVKLQAQQAEERIAALRAELAAVRAAREALYHPAIETPQRSSRWQWSCALLSVLCLGRGGLLLMPQPPPPPQKACPNPTPAVDAHRATPINPPNTPATNRPPCHNPHPEQSPPPNLTQRNQNPSSKIKIGNPKKPPSTTSKTAKTTPSAVSPRNRCQLSKPASRPGVVG